MSLIAGRGCRWPPRRDSVSPCAPLSGGRDTHDGHENSPILVFFSNLLDDPATWTEPWTARMFLRPSPGTGVIYEFACHEGNYSIEHALRNARYEDRVKGQ